MGAAKEDTNALGKDSSRTPPPFFLQQNGLTLGRTAPGWFLNTQLWNTSHAFVNSLFPRQARPQNSTLGLPAAQFRQRGLPHPLHHLGGTKANHRVESVIGIRLNAVYSWSGLGRAGLRGPSTPECCYCSEGIEVTKTKTRTADAMGGEERALMLPGVQSQDLLDLCFSNYIGLPGITCLFLKFYVMGVCSWTVVDLRG